MIRRPHSTFERDSFWDEESAYEQTASQAARTEFHHLLQKCKKFSTVLSLVKEKFDRRGALSEGRLPPAPGERHTYDSLSFMYMYGTLEQESLAELTTGTGEILGMLIGMLLYQGWLERGEDGTYEHRLHGPGHEIITGAIEDMEKELEDIDKNTAQQAIQELEDIIQDAQIALKAAYRGLDAEGRYLIDKNDGLSSNTFLEAYRLAVEGMFGGGEEDPDAEEILGMQMNG